MQETCMIRCEWLGAPRVFTDSQTVHFERRKAIGILVYLSVRTLPAARDELKSLFWPEADPESAGRSLRTALSEIRKKAPGILQETGNDMLQAARQALATDVDDFRAARESYRTSSDPESAVRDLAAVVRLWRGPFLQGFTIRASSRFDDWMLLLSETLNTELLEVLEPLSEYYLAVENAGAARSVLGIWTETDPWDEKAQRLLMRTVLLSRGRSEALRQYQRFAANLRNEMGFPPSPETEQLAREIRDGTIPEQRPELHLNFRKVHRVAGGSPRIPDVSASELHPELLLNQSLRDHLSRCREIEYIHPTDLDEQILAGSDGVSLGRRLGTPHVLSGAVRSDDAGEPAVRMDLMDALSGRTIWQHASPSAVEAIPSLVEEVTVEIVRRLTGESPRPDRMESEQPQCRAWRMQGIHLRRYGASAGIIDSIRCFEEAFRSDPACLRARAETALSYANSGAHGTWQMPVEEAYSRARQITDEVLERDPGESVALLTRATIETEYDFNPMAGLETIRRAEKADPRNPEILMMMSQILMGFWRMEEALDASRAAYALDPADQTVVLTLQSLLKNTGRFRECLDINDRYRALYPEDVKGIVSRGATYNVTGEFEKTIEILTPLVPQDSQGTMTWFIGNLGYALGRSGRLRDAETLLARLEKQHAEGRMTPYAPALTCLGMGRIDESLDWLQRCVDEMHIGTIAWTFNPEWDELLPVPRFREICSSVGVPESAMPRPASDSAASIG